MELDLGDVVASFNLRVKGMRSPQIRWHLGPTLDVRPEDRAPRPPLRNVPNTRKADLIVDLQADKKVTVSLQWTDEVGNPTEAPTDATATYTVDNDTLIDLTDNGALSPSGPLAGGMNDDVPERTGCRPVMIAVLATSCRETRRRLWRPHRSCPG